MLKSLKAILPLAEQTIAQWSNSRLKSLRSWNVNENFILLAFHWMIWKVCLCILLSWKSYIIVRLGYARIFEKSKFPSLFSERNRLEKSSWKFDCSKTCADPSLSNIYFPLDLVLKFAKGKKALFQRYVTHYLMRFEPNWKKSSRIAESGFG